MAVDKFDEESVDDVILGTDFHQLTNVPVEIAGVVQTRLLAARGAGMRSYNLTTTTAVKVAGHDPRRRFLKLNCVDFTATSHGVRLGQTANEALSPQAFILPVFQVGGTTATSVPLEISAITELWAVADTAACTLAVMSENWI